MYVAVHHNGVALCRQFGHHRADVVVAIIVHDIVGGNKGRHIATCFFGQVGVDVPIVGEAFGTVYSLVDALWATVVGCNHKVPVAKYFI